VFRIVVSLLALLGLSGFCLACSGSDQPPAREGTLEVYETKESACPECRRVSLNNPLSPTQEIDVEPNPVLVFVDDEIADLRPLHFKEDSQTPDHWQIEVWLDQAAAERLEALRRRMDPRALFVLMVNGHPIDALLAGELIDGMWIGYFESSKGLANVLHADPSGAETVIVEDDPALAGTTDWIEPIEDREAEERPLIDALAKAAARGDVEEAKRLQRKLDDLRDEH